MFLQQVYNGAAIGAIYALIGVGITLVYGLSRIIHFAVGEIVMLGAFASWEVHALTGSYTLALLGAAIAMALLGAVTERVVFRFTLKTPLTGFIVSLGLILILQGVAVVVWTANTQYTLPPVQGGWDLGRFIVIRQGLLNIAIATAVLGGCYILLTRTRFGKALRAVSDDRDAAALMGIPVQSIITAAFVGGSVLCGVAGWLVLSAGSISPQTGGTYLLRGFAVALIGGLGSVGGAALAGIGLGIAESLAAGYVGSGWNDAYVFGLMIAILLWRPTGLSKGSEGAYI
jgi:branched-chain amino acid transport system permease protein